MDRAITFLERSGWGGASRRNGRRQE